MARQPQENTCGAPSKPKVRSKYARASVKWSCWAIGDAAMEIFGPNFATIFYIAQAATRQHLAPNSVYVTFWESTKREPKMPRGEQLSHLHGHIIFRAFF